MLERIVYVSRAVAGSDPGTVHAIIRTAHARNTVLGLTGALIALDGWYAHLIEGPPAPLAATFARIAADPRHEALALRIRTPALARLFPGQALALRHRACLGADLLADFDYRPGFPVETFPVDVLTEFVIRACRQGAARAVSKGWTSGAGLPKDDLGSSNRRRAPRG
jgi:hypothetical protein